MHHTDKAEPALAERGKKPWNKPISRTLPNFCEITASGMSLRQKRNSDFRSITLLGRKMQSLLKNLFRKRLAADLLHVFHREGVESFPASRAAFNHYTAEDGRRLLVIHLRCGKPLQQIRAFRALFHPEPWLEVVFDRPVAEAGLSSGQVLAMPVGYDYERHENVTNFQYVSHESIEEIELTVASYSENKARFRLTGITGAAHGSGDTRISFDIEFEKEPGLRRSFN